MQSNLLSSGFVRASAGALCVLLIATGTGLVPLAGLSPFASGAAPGTGPGTPVAPPHVQPVTPPVAPVTPPGVVPSTSPLSHQTQAVQGPIHVDASLSHAQVARGSDGSLLVYCNLQVAEDAAADVARQPLDLALVLDTSGSMAGALPLLKRATLGIVERLAPEDRLTIVTYANSARVIFSGTPSGADQAELERAVSGLLASGGTNLSAGLLAGAERLNQGEPGRARRVLLLTDGLANKGVRAPAALGQMVNGLSAQGIAVSTLGLGSNYNESLLGNLADAGGGAYHYVDRPEGLSSVYEAEVEALRGLVASNATLSIVPRPGCSITELFSWSHTRKGAGVEVRLGDLAQGRNLKVVARLQVPTGVKAEAIEAVDVVLAWTDATSERAERIGLAPLGVGFTADTALAQASEVGAIREELQKVQVADRLAEARASAEAGRAEEAKALVLSVQEITGEAALEFEAADGANRAMDLEELADDMSAAPASERGRRARKWGDAAARGLSR